MASRGRREVGFYDLHPRGIKYRITGHAIERALEMSIEGHEIAEAMERPTQTYFSRNHQKWCLTAGRVTVCVAPDDEGVRIVTVLWATEEAWRADYARGGITDRAPRDNVFGAYKRRPGRFRHRAPHTQ